MRIILVLTWPSKLQLAKKPRGQIEVEATNGFLYHYYQTDHLGTPLRMTTATGIISWQAQASTFGDTKIDMQIASTRLAAENNHRFPGQYYDAETGLHQNYFRDYEASLGRYVQRDPIGLRGGINVFGYVGAGPIGFVDPAGLDWKFIGWRTDKAASYSENWLEWLWTNWVNVYALCEKEHECGAKEYKEVLAYSWQTRPICIGSPTCRTQIGNSSALDSMMDIYSATSHARKCGSLNGYQCYMRKTPESEGKKLCDTLPV